ncbi:MCE family protein [Mycobacterium colombiense]
MTSSRIGKIALAIVLVSTLICGLGVVLFRTPNAKRTTVTAYFENSNGIYQGDDVRILGIRVGGIEKIEPQPQRVKITFWVDSKYRVPADAKAVILSPSLVSARAIQLTPAYVGGPVLRNGAVIAQDHTAVPVEWDDFRTELEKLTRYLQPTEPGGVSTLGAFIDSAADNLRGQGANIRDTVIKLAQAFSALGDHSKDIFSTVRNLSTLVSALQSSSDLMSQLNRNFAAVSGLLANDHDEVGQAANDLATAATDVKGFVADNREALGTTSDRLASISKAVVDSREDIKKTLHVAPNAFANFINIYDPAHAAITGIAAINNFANPISFLCGAIQAASRLNAQQSAKLCVQYLAPIIKNRQYNFPPLGINQAVGAQARPNEITYSEDWLRPDYVPPPSVSGPPAEENALPAPGPPAGTPPVPPAAKSNDPAAGLAGLMAPAGDGS